MYKRQIVAWAAELRTMVPMSLEAMQTEHEADKTTSMMINVAIDRSCELADKIVSSSIYIFTDLKVFPDRMRKNLDLSGGLIMSEQIMLELGKKLGRQRAHDVVYDAAQHSAKTGVDFISALNEQQEITQNFKSDEINSMLDPEQYLGLCVYFAEHFAAEAKKLL